MITVVKLQSEVALAIAAGAVAWRAPAFAATAGLFALIFAITMFAGPLTGFTDATAGQLLAPGDYIRAVLGGAP